MAVGYANFGWMVHNRNIDPYELNKSTSKQIKLARSSEEAKAILKKFAKTFKDPHFRLLFPSGAIKTFESPVIYKSDRAQMACQKLGPDPIKNEFRFAIPIEGVSAFGHRVVPAQNGSIAFIRIPSFHEPSYVKSCESEWENFRQKIKTPICDDQCIDNFSHRLANRLTKHFQSSLLNLKRRKFNALVIDLRGNGGGSGWVSAITRSFVPDDIVCGGAGIIPKAITSCDRVGYWTIPNFEANCEVLAMSPPKKCKPDPVYKYQAGIYKGPLFFLVDRGTASSAEEIVAQLKDNLRAKVIGTRTMGAGCGYVDGGNTVNLPHSHGVLKMSNCARFFLDGTNEVEGIAPDIELEENATAKDIIEAVSDSLQSKK